MPRSKGATAIDPAKQGAILIATDKYDRPYTEVAKELNLSANAVRFARKRVHEEADKENISPLEAANRKRSRSGRPLKLDYRDRRRLVRHATKNKRQRQKLWTEIAQECGIEASLTAIRHAFEIAGYSRYPPRYKPYLNETHKQKRLEFCIEMLEHDSDWWKKVVWTDETPVKVGQRRGQIWVTRKKNEAYHKDCVHPRFSKYSDLMFWGAFSAEMRGPHHFYARETAEEKEEAQKNIDEINADYHTECQRLEAEWKAENARRSMPGSKKKPLKRCWKPNWQPKVRKKGLKGGVDWYRYRTEVLLPKLLPFCREIIQKYGECYLLEDGASPHIAWENAEEYNIEGLNRIPWPANSPDFNMIEQAWYYLKRKAGERAFVTSTIESTKAAWSANWEKLPQERIGRWVGRIGPNLQRALEQKGDNNFHG